MIAGASSAAIRLPANVEAEAIVIGALMIDNRSIDRIADRIVPDDFFEPMHGRIFSAIVKEFSQGRAANPVTLAPYLRDDPALNELGGMGYLAQLTSSNAALLAVETCADQIRDMAQRRRLISGLEEAARMAADMDITNAEVIDTADAAIAPAGDAGEGVVQITAAKAFQQMLAAYDEPVEGVSTGGRIACLDDVGGPIRPGNLIVWAARPGMGKTAVAVTSAIGAAMKGHGVLFVSLEMSRIELIERATADVCFDGRLGIPYETIRTGRFGTDNARNIVYQASRTFNDLPLNIVDAATLTIGRLNMIVRRHKRRMAAKGQKLDLVIVDYLQLLRPDGRTNSLNEAVSEVSRGLKSIAKAHEVGVVALAQLNRNVESRENKRPMLSDLRDSGQIEQDADAVVFLHRDEYYLRQGKPDESDAKFPLWQEAMDRVAGRIDFIVAKRRNGPQGTATGRFYGVFQAVRGDVL